MAATLIAVNERAHIDLDGVDVGAESAVLGATDGPHFIGPGGERFVAAQSITGTMTFANYLRAMRRADLRLDPPLRDCRCPSRQLCRAAWRNPGMDADIPRPRVA